MTANSLYITGGMQRRNAQKLEEWNAFQKARLLKVDINTLKVDVAYDYVAPKEYVPDFPSHVFKAGSRAKDTLYLCTQTEILILDARTNELKHKISHPWMNDLHHVLPDETAEYLYVANTGLDQVLKLSLSGEIIKEWSTCDIPTWERFDKEVDYRKIESTKPHISHPNFLFNAEDRLYVSRFQDKDAICLDAPDRKFIIEENYIHDGIPHGNNTLFTTVDGRIYIFDAPGSVPHTVNLNDIESDSRALGWCRGLYPVSDELLWIGFTRLRPTKIKEHLSWIKHGFKKVGDYNTLPTRIVLYDIKAMKKLKEIDLEPFGLNAIFSIL